MNRLRAESLASSVTRTRGGGATDADAAGPPTGPRTCHVSTRDSERLQLSSTALANAATLELSIRI
jgi:hypothetical protein